MNQTELEKEILKRLYDAWERHGMALILEILDAFPGIDQAFFYKVVDDLEAAELLVNGGEGGLWDIRPLGVIETEKRGLVAREKIERHEYMRFLCLSSAATAFEVHGKYEEVNADELSSQFGLDITVLMDNLTLLHDLKLIRLNTVRLFQITQIGLKENKIRTQLQRLKEEYSRISRLEPSPRGIAFEKLMAEVLRVAGWSTEESVRTSYEQMDIFIIKNGSIYLIECKWENGAVGTNPINHLLAKLNMRDGARGILMSMSGFTAGAVQSVEDSTTQKLMLLFGRKDTEQLIDDPSAFDSLLNEKHKEIVMRRKAVWT